MKILIFSLEQGALGGIASVNATLKSALEKRGNTVSQLFFRRAKGARDLSGTVIRTIPWQFPEGRAIKEALRKGKVVSALRLGFGRLIALCRRALDNRRAARWIRREDPDAILVTHYLLLDAICRTHLNRTFLHVHTSFSAAVAVKKGEEVMRRYCGKIAFLWLSQATANQAIRAGFFPSFYSYNPLPFEQTAPVCAEEHRDVVVICRFSEEKRLPLAVSLLKKAMERCKDRPFRVLFYGEGPEKEALCRAVAGDDRFLVMPRTDRVRETLETARFIVNTSSFEGFSMSILEGACVGVPAVSFVFGEAAAEEILDKQTGLLVPMDDTEAYLEALEEIICSDDLCRALSRGAYAHATRFQADAIALRLEEILSRAPLDKAQKTE